MRVFDHFINFGKRDFFGLVGLFFFGYFLILSIVLYQECIIFQDYAWELTWMLNEQGGNPVYFRWGAIPWRIFFLLGPAIDLSLKWLILLSSVWFVASKFIAWLICHFYFKNAVASLLVVASVIFSQAEGFFAQNLQVFYGSVYFCFLYVLITDKNRIKREALRVALLTILLLLIKGTHVGILLACPPIVLLYLSKDKSVVKIVPIAIVGAYIVISQLFFPSPYESGHIQSMLLVIRNLEFQDLTGILFYVGKQILGIAYLIPLLLFVVGIKLLFEARRYLSTFCVIGYSIFLWLLVLTKLITYNADYPLSSAVNYYIDGAFYPLSITFASIFFYATSRIPSFFSSKVFRTAAVCTMFFYTSIISVTGLQHLEYNRYLSALMEDIQGSFSESIFIIDEKFIPSRFSRVNMNVEYETLIKSNLRFKNSVVLFVTPYAKVLEYDKREPIYVNSISSLEKDLEIDSSFNNQVYRYKTFNPSRHFKSSNSDYFKFKNFNHTILDEEYMNNFNRRYGFAISEY